MMHIPHWEYRKDIIQGLNELTQARIAHVSLPVDREIVPDFNMTAFLSERFAQKDDYPDLIAVDTSGVLLRNLDKHLPLLGQPELSHTHELGLPGLLTFTSASGECTAYELCSFISLERPGIAEKSSFISKIKSLYQEVACASIVHEAATQSCAARRTIATVRYGDQWFITDNGCIWKVEQPETCTPEQLGEALLHHQPGRRELIFYRKRSPKISPALSSSSNDIDLTLTKVYGREALAYKERPLYHAAVGVQYLIHGMAGVLLLQCGWRAAEPHAHSFSQN